MNMLTEQLRLRRLLLKRKTAELSRLTGINRPRISAVLTKDSSIDPRASTIESMAAGLDAEWVLVPKHLLPEVKRLLAGKDVSPDDLPSSMERMLG